MSIPDLHFRALDVAKHDTDLQVFGAVAHKWVRTPVSADALTAFEAANGALPEPWRAWLTLHGTGAGPFYGVKPLPVEVREGEFATDGEGPLPGCLVLTDQGCGYEDLLVLRGPHRGEVWVDLRAADGPVAPWYPDVEAWLEAWLSWAEAGWAMRYAARGGAVSEGFRDRVIGAVERALQDSNDPILVQYPHARDDLLVARAHLCLAAGDFEGAAAAFQAGAEASSEPVGRAALGRALVAEASGDAAGRLAAAEEGLAASGLWFTTEMALHQHRIAALEALERWDDAVVAREACCDASPGDAGAWLTLAWIHCAREDFAAAVVRIRGLAAEEVDADEVDARVAEHAAGILAALREQGRPEDAAALEAELRRR